MLTATEQEQIRALRNKYYRQYRAKNPEKIKAIHERYWLKKLQKLKKQDFSS